MLPSISSEEKEMLLSQCLCVLYTPVNEHFGIVPLEAMAAVLDRMGAETGIDIFKLADAAEDHVLPILDEPVRLSRDALVLGYAGAYSSFLLFAKRAEARWGVPSHQILLEMARRKTVGGQEDLIEAIAIEMSEKTEP